MSSTSNYYFIVLPSDVPDYPENKPNKYRVHLPRHIEFQGGSWVCGLYSIQYPQSWASTIGTNEQQWIQIYYKNGTFRSVNIPKTSQQTPEGLSEYLKYALLNQSLLSHKNLQNRKRRFIELEKEEEKRVRRETTVGNENNWINNFFIEHPEDYWKHIQEEKKVFETLEKTIKNKLKESDNETDRNKQKQILAEIVALNGTSDSMLQRINSLENAAKAKDEENKRIENQIAEEFFRVYPEPERYHEKITEERLRYISMVEELQQKVQLYKDAKSIERIQELDNETKIIRQRIKLLEKNLRILSKAIIQKDSNKSYDDYQKQNIEKNSEFVNDFFQKNPDYWTAIGKQFKILQDTYKEIRVKRETLSAVTIPEEKDNLKKEIENLRKIAEYRRHRFNALEYEAKIRDERSLPESQALTGGLLQQVRDRLQKKEGENDQNSQESGGLLEQTKDKFSNKSQENTSEERGEKTTSEERGGLLDRTKAKFSDESQETASKEKGGLLERTKAKLSDKSQEETTSKEGGEDVTSEEKGGLLERTKAKLSDKSQENTPEERGEETDTGLIQQVREKLADGVEEETNQKDTGLIQQVREKLADGVEEETIDQETESKGLLEIVRQRLIPIEGIPEVDFEYIKNIDRYHIKFNNPEISHISLSEQIAYVVGFKDETRHYIENGEIGKYTVDLQSGYSSFAVYANGLTRSVILGNSLSSLLRIVAVENQVGGYVERVYDQPMFIPVLPRQINEIEIELKWLNGKYVPFEYGTVTVTLVFKKIINL